MKVVPTLLWDVPVSVRTPAELTVYDLADENYNKFIFRLLESCGHREKANSILWFLLHQKISTQTKDTYV